MDHLTEPTSMSASTPRTSMSELIAAQQEELERLRALRLKRSSLTGITVNKNIPKSTPTPSSNYYSAPSTPNRPNERELRDSAILPSSNKSITQNLSKSSRASSTHSSTSYNSAPSTPNTYIKNSPYSSHASRSSSTANNSAPPTNKNQSSSPLASADRPKPPRTVQPEPHNSAINASTVIGVTVKERLEPSPAIAVTASNSDSASSASYNPATPFSTSCVVTLDKDQQPTSTSHSLSPARVNFAPTSPTPDDRPSNPDIPASSNTIATDNKKQRQPTHSASNSASSTPNRSSSDAPIVQSSPSSETTIKRRAVSWQMVDVDSQAEIDSTTDALSKRYSHNSKIETLVSHPSALQQRESLYAQQLEDHELPLPPHSSYYFDSSREEAAAVASRENALREKALELKLQGVQSELLDAQRMLTSAKIDKEKLVMQSVEIRVERDELLEQRSMLAEWNDEKERLEKELIVIRIERDDLQEQLESARAEVALSQSGKDFKRLQSAVEKLKVDEQISKAALQESEKRRLRMNKAWEREKEDWIVEKKIWAADTKRIAEEKVKELEKILTEKNHELEASNSRNATLHQQLASRLNLLDVASVKDEVNDDAALLFSLAARGVSTTIQSEKYEVDEEQESSNENSNVPKNYASKASTATLNRSPRASFDNDKKAAAASIEARLEASSDVLPLPNEEKLDSSRSSAIKSVQATRPKSQIQTQKSNPNQPTILSKAVANEMKVPAPEALTAKFVGVLHSPPRIRQAATLEEPEGLNFQPALPPRPKTTSKPPFGNKKGAAPISSSIKTISATVVRVKAPIKPTPNENKPFVSKTIPSPTTSSSASPSLRPKPLHRRANPALISKTLIKPPRSTVTASNIAHSTSTPSSNSTKKANKKNEKHATSSSPMPIISVQPVAEKMRVKLPNRLIVTARLQQQYSREDTPERLKSKKGRKA